MIKRGGRTCRFEPATRPSVMPTASGGCPVSSPRVRDGTARYGWRPGDQAASPLARRGPRIEPQSDDHLEGVGGSRPRVRTRRSGEAPNRHCEVSTSLVTTQKVGGSTPSWDATKVAPRGVTPPSSNPGAPIESHQAMRKRLETAGHSRDVNSPGRLAHAYSLVQAWLRHLETLAPPHRSSLHS